uniref:hypothetical protein n=1 Tax=Burkholderia ambifaria TaxID=152480 RepID=UPI001589ED68
MQQACGAHGLVGHAASLGDRREFAVKYASEREQIIALVLQRHAQRADAAQIEPLALTQLLDDEVEQRLALGQRWPGQRQDVVTEPLGERADVARQGLRPRFSLARPAQPLAVVPGAATAARPAQLRLELQALRACPHGQPLQCVGERLTLALDVEHIAMAGRLAPSDPLSGAQPLGRIGNRVCGCETLLCGLEQVHAPGVAITMVLGDQQVTVGRICIDARQHRAITVEDLVMQAHADAREVLLSVDGPRPLSGPLHHVVHVAFTDRQAQGRAQTVSDSARPFPRSRASGMMVMAWWSPCRSRAIVSMIG